MGKYRISRNFGEKNIWQFEHQLHLAGIKFDKMLCSHATLSHLSYTIPMTPGFLRSAAGGTSITVLPKRNVACARVNRFARNGASPIKGAWYPFSWAFTQHYWILVNEMDATPSKSAITPYVFTRFCDICQKKLIGDFKFGDSAKNRQTAKLKSSPIFLLIRYTMYIKQNSELVSETVLVLLTCWAAKKLEYFVEVLCVGINNR